MSDSLQPHELYGALQARILEWVAFPFSRDFPNPGVKPRSPALQTDSLSVEPQKQSSRIWSGTYPFCSRSSQSRNQIRVSCIAGGFFTNWAIREAHEFCMDLYALFRWSGTPVHSQRVFSMHFCVWRCVPDVFVERDILHIHLLLRHLVLYLKWSFERSVFSCLWPTFSSSYSYCWHSA